MVEDDIYKALMNGVTEAVDGELDIQFPLVTFNPPNSKKYLEFVQIINNSKGDFWGAEKVYRGTLRLLLHWPLNDEGLRPALQYLRGLSVKLPKAGIMRFGEANVTLTDHPDISSHFMGSGDVVIPLSIPYQHIQLASAA